MRVVERAKTLRIATWLHHLDMVVEGDQIASQTLEATQHRRGPLLNLLLAPMMGSLTFAEVVDRVLDENWHREESSLAKLHGHHTQIRGELDDLIEACRAKSDMSAGKRLKREIDLRGRTLRTSRLLSPITSPT